MDIKHDKDTFAVYGQKGHIFLEDSRRNVSQSLGWKLSYLRPTQYDKQRAICLSLQIPGLTIYASLRLSGLFGGDRKTKP